MRGLTGLLFLVFLYGTKGEWYDEPLEEYLTCMSKNSKASLAKDYLSNSFHEVVETVPERKKAKETVILKKVYFDDEVSNEESSPMPVSFKTVVTSSATNLKQDVKGNTYGVSAGGGGNIGKVGISVSGHFKQGSVQNDSQTSENVTQQSWERSFKLPPHMKFTRKMSLYEKQITMPGSVQSHITGYIPIQFENFKKSKFREIWRDCGVSKPKPLTGTGEKILAVKVNNLIPKNTQDKWISNKDGSISFYIRYKEITETKQFMRIEKKVLFRDPNVKLSEYCDDIDLDDEAEAFTQTKMEKGKHEKNVEGNVDINKYELDIEGIGEGDDDDDHDKKKKKKNKKKKNKKKGK